MAKCPNKAHPDWKALVAKEGEKGAYLQYVKNGYEIPPQDNVKKSRAKIKITERFDAFGSFFKSKNTLDSMEKHPEDAAKIIDELARLYPDVRVFKDRIIDENGNYLNIPSDKMGRHYRSAFMSAVAWSNDSSLETPPHEYAHEYIDMYRNVPFVAAAIEKYGEERLVTLIGRKYAGQKMSNSFNKFINEFWKTIRRMFGAPSVVDILTDSFAKNEQLGKPFSRGTEVAHNFQDSTRPMYEKETAINFDEATEESASSIKIMTQEEVETIVFNQLNSEWGTDASQKEELNGFRSWWRNTIGEAKSVTRMDPGETTNYSDMDQSIFDAVNKVIVDSDAQSNIIQKIKGNDVELSKDEKKALEAIYDIVKGIEHRKVTNASYIDPNVSNAKMVGEEVVDSIAIDEAENQIKKREERIKSKNKVLQWAEKTINKQLRWITNPRLWSKYVSGGENTMISRVLYKGLNNGREGFSRFSNTFLDFFKATPQSYYDGSTYHNKKADINELETTTIELDTVRNSGIKAKSIQLTKAELLSIYLMNRQADGATDLRKGIYLNTIKGRNLKRSNKYILTDEQIAKIVFDIESDPQAKELVKEIDAAMEYSHNELNGTYRLLEGFDLKKIPKYFPITHGAEGTGISKKKNVIENMRNLRLRSAYNMPVRLQDPFKVMADMRMANASYVGYAIPIHNAQKMIQSLDAESLNDRDTANFINALRDNINQIQDPALLYSSQGDKETGQLINKLQGNFAVALLGYNPGVIFKQQVSLETAATAINRKYIRKSGATLGGLNFINPIDLLKQLSFSGDKTMMPVEWTKIQGNDLYNELMKYPMFRDRFEGMVSRETGEAIMGRQAQDDLIEIPFKKDKDGKPLKISKSRLMMGITMMDTLTIMRLYSAVKLETKDRMSEPLFAQMTEQQIEEHNINRLQQIVDKTQPTFDQTNRTGLAKSSNPIVRVLTMFSSATQKISEQLIDGMIDYNMNPTTENLKKMGIRIFHTAVTTSIMLTTIDILWGLAKGNWDDDDFATIPSTYAWGTLKSSFGAIHGIGTILNVVISQLDDKPWSQDIQDPVISIMQEGSEAIANLFKGNFLKALKGSSNAVFKATGVPVSPTIIMKNYAEKLSE